MPDLLAVQEGKKYKGSAFGSRIIAGALAMEPQMSIRGMELIVGASIASLFADANIGISKTYHLGCHLQLQLKI